VRLHKSWSLWNSEFGGIPGQPEKYRETGTGCSELRQSRGSHSGSFGHDGRTGGYLLIIFVDYHRSSPHIFRSVLLKRVCPKLDWVPECPSCLMQPSLLLRCTVRSEMRLSLLRERETEKPTSCHLAVLALHSEPQCVINLIHSIYSPIGLKAELKLIAGLDFIPGSS
jgi:hypothetical protein